MESINAGGDFTLDSLKYRKIDGIDGLVTAIAQDYETGEVLMVAYMNREAVEKTLSTGKMHYYSTTRKKLWLKGESSGHVQTVKEAYVDCDGDAMLFSVEQEGGACHEGYRSCFFRRIKDGKIEVTKKKVFDPKKVY